MVELAELGEVGIRVRSNGRRVDAVDLDQRRFDCLDHVDHTRRVCPEVRIRHPGGFSGGIVKHLDDLTGDDHRYPCRTRPVDVLLQPFLEAQPVRDEEVSVFHRCRLLRRYLERMRVGVRLHELDDLCLVARDLRHDVAKDVGRDDDVGPDVHRAWGATREGECCQSGTSHGERA